MMRTRHWIALSLLAQFAPFLVGQAAVNTNTASPQDDARYRQIDERLNGLTTALEQTRGELAAAVDEIHRLRVELEKARVGKAPEVSVETDAARLTEEVARIREDQDVIQEQVKVHAQVKVETLSRYHLWFSGLILFNAFANRGAVDVPDLPNIALPFYNPTGNNVAGASVRQTIIGLSASGPHLFGAQSTADLNLDFSSNGNAETYPAASGSARIHTAHIKLEWPHDRIEVGFTEPLISPLSPTSYASVAQAPLAWAGNLSAWAPQLRFEHWLQLNEANQLGLEVGLWNAVYGGTNLNPYQGLPSGEESERWPAVESRIAWTVNSSSPFHIGLGGYRGALKTKYGATIPSWAFSSDFALRLFTKLSISGELYRGSSLAGLGGGSHKDFLTGIDPSTGDERSIGLNSVGGWTQFKLAWSQAVEFNAVIGEDSGYGRDFRSLLLASNNNPIGSLARNQMVTGNFIFRPRTYLILSPEYRRILSGRLSGSSYVANVFTLAAGYSF
jgi:regulator of replication initiation timing